MNATTTPPSEKPPEIQERETITFEDMVRIAREPLGPSRLLVLARDQNLDPNKVADAIISVLEKPSRRLRRALIALIDAMLP